MGGMAETHRKNWLSHQWRVLGHAGVHPYFHGDTRPIVATNQLALLASIIFLSYSIAMFATSWPDLISPGLVCLGLVVGWDFCLILNSKGLHFIASSIALLLPILALGHLTAVFTTESGFHYLLFAVGTLSFAVFRSDQWLLRAVFLFIAVATLVFCEAMFPSNSSRQAFSGAIIDRFLVINIVLTVLLLYAVGRFDLHYYERERQRNVVLLDAAQVAAQTDALTEVYNRRGIAPILSSVSRRGTTRSPLSILIDSNSSTTGWGMVLVTSFSRTPRAPLCDPWGIRERSLGGEGRNSSSFFPAYPWRVPTP